ncbi:hypothetical protein AVEN_84129-1 [Araneus ventricosus]|uniref:HTH psq-type domain-containing protein n=1 Tax=Araneus ventricosus TaxID=182803 RepID=A0A4Y2UCK6_ARAVE|nr:hypothetical protein AVEN_84129-1 [Araneus ventricosus]
MEVWRRGCQLRRRSRHLTAVQNDGVWPKIAFVLLQSGLPANMVRYYVRKSDRGNASSETMKVAILEVKLNKKSIRGVSQQYGIHRNTLTRYCNKYEELFKSPHQS